MSTSVADIGNTQEIEANLQDTVTNILEMASSCGATSAEVDIARNIGFNLTVRKGEVETVEFNRDKGVAITAYVGKRTGNASTTDLSIESLKSTVEAACSIAKEASEDPFSGLADKERLAFGYQDNLELYNPWDINHEQAIEIAKRCEDHALSQKGITNSDGTTIYSHGSVSVYANTHGFVGTSKDAIHGFNNSLIAGAGDNMQTDGDYAVNLVGSKLPRPELVADSAVAKTLGRLNPRKIKTGSYPVIYSAELARGLFRNFFSAISGGALYRQSSFLLDSCGKQVFPDFINISEDPSVVQGFSSCCFDDEGVTPVARDIVKDGVVQSYILSSYSARKLNLQSTANAGGLHNTFVTTSEKNLQDLLREMGTGILLTDVMGQGINIVTGDYSRGGTGFWVENGEIQYPINEFTVASNLKEMFQNIIAVGNDVDLRSSLQTGSLFINNMMVAGI